MSARRRWVAVALLLAAVLAGWQAMRLQVDNRLERWMGDDDAGALAYHELRENFGSDEFILVTVSGDVLSAPVLDLMVAAVARLEAVPGVSRVQGLPVVYRDLFGGEDAEALAEEALATPFYKGLFVADDGRTLSLLLQVEPAGAPDSRRRISHQVDAALAPLREDGLRVEMVGSTVLAAALDRVSMVEGRRSLALALVLALTILALLLRSWRAMLVGAACSALAVVLTLGIMAATGRTLNMISTSLPVLLGVLSLAGVIHVLGRYQDLRCELDQETALRQALAETSRPCVVAAVTTAIGFLSLLAATMAPVRDLGLLVATGMVLSLAVNLTVGPLLIGWFRVGPRRGRSWMPARGAGTGARHPRLVLAVAAVLVLLAVIAVPRVRVAANPLSFLPEHDPTVTAYRHVGDNLGGFYSLEVVVRLPEPWWRPQPAAQLDRVARELAASPIVARVMSPLDLLRQLNRWDNGLEPEDYRLPPTAADARRLLDGLDGPGVQALRNLATPDGMMVRLSAVVRQMDEAPTMALAAATRSRLRDLPEGYGGEVTGMVLRLVSAQQALVRTQVATLALAAVVVIVAIGIGLRSPHLAVLSAVPNLLPMASIFALMAVASLPLDAASVMVASIALGIGVDDAVHFLESFARHRRHGSVSAALEATMTATGPALVMTTVTACLGFGALCTSAFAPVRHFGLLAAVALVVALAADLLVVPAILVLLPGNRGDDGRS